MSRQSYATLGRQSYAPGFSSGRARESTFNVPSSSYIDSLDECVNAAEGCVKKMDEANATFYPGVEDMPRLIKVFDYMHHYLVIPQPVVQRRKDEYVRSLEPQIDALFTRADTLLGAERAEVERLQARLDMLEAARTNLPSFAATPRLRHPKTFAGLGIVDEEEGDRDTRSRLEGVEMNELSLAQRRRIGFLKNKREKLEREMARLAGQGR